MLTQRYSTPALDIAETIGAADLLARITRLEQGGDAGDLATERARLGLRIDLAELAVQSVVAELGCDHERIQIVVESLRSQEDTNTRAYTVSSLLVTSVTGIVTSALTPVSGATRTEAVIGITGGVVGGALGVAALFVHATVSFRHPRNLLREIWQGPDRSALFPDVVWAYLSSPRFSLDQRHSLRANLVRGWITLGRLGGHGVPTPRLVELYFGEGGRFDADELHALVAMLSELRSAVELMQQDLLQLASETAVE